MRQAQVTRKTGETDITLTVNLDGAGRYDIRTGVGFFDHMLTGFARHGKFDLTVTCTGDTWVDDHHTVEDVGICLGQAFAQALGEMRGVERFGQSLLPMDETLILGAVDLSGRGMLCWDVALPTAKVGTFGWPSPGKPAAPSTCGRWRGRTATTSWRGSSRPPAAA